MVHHSFIWYFYCHHCVLYLMHMHLINDAMYRERTNTPNNEYMPNSKAHLIIRVQSNSLGMPTVNFVPHKISYNVAIYLELTWQYPLCEFHSKQTRAVLQIEFMTHCFLRLKIGCLLIPLPRNYKNISLWAVMYDYVIICSTVPCVYHY